jgi:2-C-methyl-D-erythritol 2,4-cyclodiphosphate synthase
MTDQLRVGIGFDAHAFADGRRLVLAGVEIPSPRGLEGHSDADLVSHAVTDALLGAAGGEDIGALFPSDDPGLEGASSIELLRRAWAGLAGDGWSIVNVDAIVIMQAPRLAPHRDAMREALAAALGVSRDRVTVRASTTDLLGFTGRGEGAACQAVALLRGA